MSDNDDNNADSISAGLQEEQSQGVLVLRRTRKSSRQASEAQLDEKKARESLTQRYSVAFKEATVLMSPECSSQLKMANHLTADEIIHRLNQEHCLYGTKKQLARSTVY